MRRNILILLCLIFGSLLCTAYSASAQKALPATVSNHISEQAGAQQASEPAKTRKIIRADLDGDGDKDAVVQYMLEGFEGGNNWTQILAVFRNDRGVYKFATEYPVGGKLSDKTFILKKVINQRIYLDTQSCSDIPQGVCENPKMGRAVFVFRKGKLQEL